MTTKQDYIKPDVKKDYYTCIYCNKYARQYGNVISNRYNEYLIMKICDECDNYIIWETDTFYTYSKEIYPWKPSLDIEPNEDMDKEDKDLFNEAKDIFDRSPKAAGALLRSVLESILRKKFSEKHSKSLLGSILNDNEVKNMLGDYIMKLCTACKSIGNITSHSDYPSLLINKNEKAKYVEDLFELINSVADEIISNPLKKENELNKSKEINKKLDKNKDKN